MILTLEASHTTITRPWDEKLQDFSTDPLKEEYDRITLYRDIPTFAEYVCAIADTELGILASSSPEEFTSSIKELIEGLKDDNNFPDYDEIYWSDHSFAWSARLTLYEDDESSYWKPEMRGSGVDRWHIEYDPWGDHGFTHLVITGKDNYRQEVKWKS